MSLGKLLSQPRSAQLSNGDRVAARATFPGLPGWIEGETPVALGTIHSGTHSVGHFITVRALEESTNNNSSAWQDSPLQKPKQDFRRQGDMGWGWLVCHSVHTSTAQSVTSPRCACDRGQPSSRLPFSFNRGDLGKLGHLTQEAITLKGLSRHRAGTGFSLKQQSSGQDLLLPPRAGRPTSVNQQHRPGREDRSGGMEACQTGPLRRSVRPLWTLGARGVLGFSENGPRAGGAGTGRGSRTSWAHCCLGGPPQGLTNWPGNHIQYLVISHNGKE